MKMASSQTRWLAQESTRKVLRRASGTAAVLAVLAAAIGVPVMSPQPDAGTNPVLAIARADCPPDCGGGPGNGGTPTGPPGGGTEFVPPSIPAMPSYDPGRGQPPLDQNNGISIYNSAAPQPSQAAQPSQAPVQNQDGSYSRAANGEQQPINYNNAPNNQQLNNEWQNLSNKLNNSQSQGQQSGQDGSQTDQARSQDKKFDKTCAAVLAPLGISMFDGSVSLGIPKLSKQATAELAKAGLKPSDCEQQNAAAEEKVLKEGGCIFGHSDPSDPDSACKWTPVERDARPSKDDMDGCYDGRYDPYHILDTYTANGEIYQLRCGVVTGLLHIEEDHPVRPHGGPAMSQCIANLLAWGWPEDSPDYNSALGFSYPQGAESIGAIVAWDNATHDIVTVYTKGGKSNDWAACANAGYLYDIYPPFGSA